MTHKQAENVADRIIKLVHEAVPASEQDTWIMQQIEVTQADAGALTLHGGMIVGCLPAGWHIVEVNGDTRVTVRRASNGGSR